MEAINKIPDTQRVACLYRVSTKGQIDNNDIRTMNNNLNTIHSKLKADENRLHNLIELQNSLDN